MSKVLVHPSFDPNWNSYALLGLAELYGASSLSYGTRGFPEVGDYTEAAEGSLLYCVVDGLRLVVQTSDELAPVPSAIEWCDVYAKTNLRRDAGDLSELEKVADHAHKLVPFAPYFTVRAFGPVRTLSTFARTWRPRLHSPLEHAKRHLYRAYRYYPRPSFFEDNRPPSRPVAFYRCTPWRDEPTSNRLRAAFIRACRDHPDVEFVGGFRERRDGYIEPELEDLLCERIPGKVGELERRSSFAYAAPAVQGNHSWRLGICLALGLAIIAPWPERKLIADLTHGENVHHIDSCETSVEQAVERIATDDSYRARLQQGAAAYYERHASPRRLMQAVLRHAG